MAKYLILSVLLCFIGCVERPKEAEAPFQMSCTETHNHPYIRRCENNEVICYILYDNPFQCIPKEYIEDRN